MDRLALLRGISGRIAHLTVRQWGGANPTARWQDKSRSLRRGWAAEECRRIRHLARGAPARDSLPLGAIHWHFAIMRTSRAPAP